nr:DUF6252 family protein [uncultured Psychroserpens sp.]
MKTLKTMIPKTTLVLILIIVMLNSCSSSDDTDASGQSAYYLTAKIDGVNYSREFVTVSALPDETDAYIISAVGEISSIGLSLESPISTGTFTSSIGDLTVLFYQEINPYAVWASSDDVGSGTITVTENTDTYIKGTFSFTGVNQLDNSIKVITDGNFKAQKL